MYDLYQALFLSLFVFILLSPIPLSIYNEGDGGNLTEAVKFSAFMFLFLLAFSGVAVSKHEKIEGTASSSVMKDVVAPDAAGGSLSPSAVAVPKKEPEETDHSSMLSDAVGLNAAGGGLGLW